MTIELNKTAKGIWEFYGNSEDRRTVVARAKLKEKKRKLVEASVVQEQKTKKVNRRKKLFWKCVSILPFVYPTTLALEWLFIG